MRFLQPVFLLGICCALLIALTAAGLTLPQAGIGQFGIGYGKPLDHFVILGCAQGLIYFVAVALMLRSKPTARMVGLVLAGAIVLRLMVVVFPPFLSNDMYRYIWDGWVQAAGINPYRYIPADAHLAFLRDAAVFPNINRADYAHTIYPPAAEICFFLAAGIGRLLAAPVLTMKLAMLGFEAGGIWAMLRLLDHAGLPRTRILIYAWNPLPVWEFAGSGHVDAIAICCIALALLAALKGRRGASAIALGVAALAKFLPLILFPALWRRWDWKFAAVFVATIVILYAPYLDVGKGVFGFLGGYGAQEGIDDGQGIFPLAVIGRLATLPPYAPELYLAVLALLLIFLGWAMVFGPVVAIDREAAARMIAKRALLLGCVVMVGLSPHYPWYYCWLLIPACIMPCSSVIYLVTATFLLYLNPTHTEIFWPAFVYGPFAVLAARDAWAGKASVMMTTMPLTEGDRT